MAIYELIGSGIEDMTTTLNYEVTTTRDVIGQTRTIATKGANTITVDPITINPNSEFAKWVDTAIEREFELSQLEKEFVFVKLYKRTGGKMVAFRQTAIVVPQEWAMGNQDLRGSVEINLTGKRIHGTFDPEATGEKFTPEAAMPTDVTYDEGDAPREAFGMYYVGNNT